MNIIVPTIFVDLLSPPLYLHLSISVTQFLINKSKAHLISYHSSLFLTSVTRCGDFLPFGQLFKAFENN